MPDQLVLGVRVHMEKPCAHQGWSGRRLLLFEIVNIPGGGFQTAPFFFWKILWYFPKAETTAQLCASELHK